VGAHASLLYDIGADMTRVAAGCASRPAYGRGMPDPAETMTAAPERCDPPLVSAARAAVAHALDGRWEPAWGNRLRTAGGDLKLVLREQGGELRLEVIEAFTPGRRLGTRAVYALREFCERDRRNLAVGPITNSDYWNRPEFRWLEWEDMWAGFPVFRYRASGAKPRAA
jgi:hypothetical protein